MLEPVIVPPHDPTEPTSKPAPIILSLPGYLTPSLNRLFGKHWTASHREKQLARAALLSALRATPADSSTPTISQAAANLSSINSDTPPSSRTTTRQASNSNSARRKSPRKPSK
jgi:hypothetical protein